MTSCSSNLSNDNVINNQLNKVTPINNNTINKNLSSKLLEIFPRLKQNGETFVTIFRNHPHDRTRSGCLQENT